MIGHCLGGAGALEAAAPILSAREGFLLPTAGFDRPRDGCHLPDFVPDPGRPWQGRIALNNSFGFGGHNACLLLDLDPSPERPLTDLREPRRSAVGITGYGVVSPLGLGPEPLADTDRTGVAPIKRFAVPVEPFPAGLVPRIDSREVDRRLDLKGFDLCSSYATLAARTCLAHAGIHPRPQITAQIGLVLGLAAGPSQGEAEHLGAVFNHGFALSSLGAFPYVVPNEVAGNTSRALLLKGHSTVLAAGPGAGLAALISAAIAVDQGHAHQVIALAADELSERTAADGYKVGNWGPGTEVIPGEGAAALLLEQQSSARARSAPILAEVLGSAMATDATSPRGTSGPDALGRAASQALAQAQVRPDQVSHFTLGGHGAATDALAIQALTSLIGDLPPPELQLAERLGFAEASLSLFELIAVLYSAEEGSITLAGFLSAEGLASALVLRTTAGVPD
jgi:3-oxoacyl-(acyl-carrier-protein) synthase